MNNTSPPPLHDSLSSHHNHGNKYQSPDHTTEKQHLSFHLPHNPSAHCPPRPNSHNPPGMISPYHAQNYFNDPISRNNNTNNNHHNNTNNTLSLHKNDAISTNISPIASTASLQSSLHLSSTQSIPPALSFSHNSSSQSLLNPLETEFYSASPTQSPVKRLQHPGPTQPGASHNIDTTEVYFDGVALRRSSQPHDKNEANSRHNNLKPMSPPDHKPTTVDDSNSNIHLNDAANAFVPHHQPVAFMSSTNTLTAPRSATLTHHNNGIIINTTNYKANSLPQPIDPYNTNQFNNSACSTLWFKNHPKFKPQPFFIQFEAIHSSITCKPVHPHEIIRNSRILTNSAVHEPFSSASVPIIPLILDLYRLTSLHAASLSHPEIKPPDVDFVLYRKNPTKTKSGGANNMNNNANSQGDRGLSNDLMGYLLKRNGNHDEHKFGARPQSGLNPFPVSGFIIPPSERVNNVVDMKNSQHRYSRVTLDSFGYNGSSYEELVQCGRLFIGQIPPNQDPIQLYFILSCFGVIEELVFLKDRTTLTHTGAAFCTFIDPVAARRAVVELDGVIRLWGANEPLMVRISPRRQKVSNHYPLLNQLNSGSLSQNVNGNGAVEVIENVLLGKIFINNIPKDINPDIIIGLFRQYDQYAHPLVLLEDGNSGYNYAIVVVQKKMIKTIIMCLNNLIFDSNNGSSPLSSLVCELYDCVLMIQFVDNNNNKKNIAHQQQPKHGQQQMTVVEPVPLKGGYQLQSLHVNDNNTIHGYSNNVNVNYSNNTFNQQQHLSHLNNQPHKAQYAEQNTWGLDHSQLNNHNLHNNHIPGLSGYNLVRNKPQRSTTQPMLNDRIAGIQQQHYLTAPFLNHSQHHNQQQNQFNPNFSQQSPPLQSRYQQQRQPQQHHNQQQQQQQQQQQHHHQQQQLHQQSQQHRFANEHTPSFNTQQQQQSLPTSSFLSSHISSEPQFPHAVGSISPFLNTNDVDLQNVSSLQHLPQAVNKDGALFSLAPNMNNIALTSLPNNGDFNPHFLNNQQFNPMGSLNTGFNNHLMSATTTTTSPPPPPPQAISIGGQSNGSVLNNNNNMHNNKIHQGQSETPVIRGSSLTSLSSVSHHNESHLHDFYPSQEDSNDFYPSCEESYENNEAIYSTNWNQTNNHLNTISHSTLSNNFNNTLSHNSHYDDSQPSPSIHSLSPHGQYLYSNNNGRSPHISATAIHNGGIGLMNYSNNNNNNNNNYATSAYSLTTNDDFVLKNNNTAAPVDNPTINNSYNYALTQNNNNNDTASRCSRNSGSSNNDAQPMSVGSGFNSYNQTQYKNIDTVGDYHHHHHLPNSTPYPHHPIPPQSNDLDSAPSQPLDLIQSIDTMYISVSNQQDRHKQEQLQYQQHHAQSTQQSRQQQQHLISNFRTHPGHQQKPAPCETAMASGENTMMNNNTRNGNGINHATINAHPAAKLQQSKQQQHHHHHHRQPSKSKFTSATTTQLSSITSFQPFTPSGLPDDESFGNHDKDQS